MEGGCWVCFEVDCDEDQSWMILMFFCDFELEFHDEFGYCVLVASLNLCYQDK